MGDYEDRDAYFARVEDLRRQVIATGIPIDLVQLRCVVHANLPPTYETLAPTQNNIDVHDYDGFKDTICTHYNSQIKPHYGSPSGGVSALVHRQRPRCTHCSRLGHQRHQCFQLQGNSRPPSGGSFMKRATRQQRDMSMTCYTCGGRGHKSVQCPTPSVHNSNQRSQANTATAEGTPVITL